MIFLQTPTINRIATFDPSVDTNVYFNYDDSQCVKNRAVIINNLTAQTVYDSTINTMRLYHTIPAGTLTGGNQYTIRIQVFDVDGNQSKFSESSLFYCYTAPSLTISNLTNNQTYKNASITLNAIYEQLENEDVRELRFAQYDYNKILLNTSNVFYSNKTPSYTFYNLENNTTYYFRVYGETSHGMIIESPYIQVNVELFSQPQKTILTLSNDYINGYIDMKVNIDDVGYDFENNNYTIDDGELTIYNNYLSWDDGLDIPGDFVLYIDAKNINGEFLSINNNVKLRTVNICGIWYANLIINDGESHLYVELPNQYLITDDERYILNNKDSLITVDSTDYKNTYIIFEIKRINGVYGLKAYYREE